MPTIRVRGQRIELAEYEENPAAFAHVLAEAKHAGEYPKCECTTPNPQLVIRHVPADEQRPDRYFLGCWPYAGTAHDRGCTFYKSEGAYEEARARLAAAVTKEPDGFGINPDFALRRVIKRASSDPAATEARDPAVPVDKRAPEGAPPPRRDALTLKETLDYLWQAGGLTAAPRSPRGWGDVHTALVDVVAHGSLGRQPLAKVLYVVPPFSGHRAEEIDGRWRVFLSRHARTEATVPLFLILGAVKFTERVGRSVATHLRQHKPTLFMSFRLATALASRFPDAEECLIRARDDERVVGLYQAEISERGKLWINDAALMPVGRNYVPLEAAGLHVSAPSNHA